MPGLRVLTPLFIAAVAISVVHYADNWANYADFPEPTSGPAPSRTLVGLSWFAFTAVGVLGYAWYRRGDLRRAGFALAAYSGSGLVGLGHYTVPGATSMPWWRHAHIAADILCGIALLSFAVWTLRRERHEAGRMSAA